MHPSGSSLRWVCAGVALLLAFGCRTAVNPRLSPELSRWPEGPVRWLLLDDEARRFAALRDDVEARRFIVEFWAKRDRDAGGEGNETRERFLMRVDVADRLYAEPSRRGSLTDRGAVYLLLGPPSELRQMRRTAPAVEPRARRMSATGLARRSIVVEAWTYRPEDLPARIRAALGPEMGADGLTFRFQVFSERAALLEGRPALKKAARALIVEDG